MEPLWRRFRAAQDESNRRRSTHFENEKLERVQNQRQKEKLCAVASRVEGQWSHPQREHGSIVESLSKSVRSDFEIAREERERKAAEWEKRRREWLENLRRKERIQRRRRRRLRNSKRNENRLDPFRKRRQTSYGTDSATRAIVCFSMRKRKESESRRSGDASRPSGDQT
jgi:hypothetical protein